MVVVLMGNARRTSSSCWATCLAKLVRGSAMSASVKILGNVYDFRISWNRDAWIQRAVSTGDTWPSLQKHIYDIVNMCDRWNKGLEVDSDSHLRQNNLTVAEAATPPRARRCPGPDCSFFHSIYDTVSAPHLSSPLPLLSPKFGSVRTRA